jgi:hypothetical protein
MESRGAFGPLIILNHSLADYYLKIIIIRKITLGNAKQKSLYLIGRQTNRFLRG